MGHGLSPHGPGGGVPLGSLGAHPDHIHSGFLCLSLDFDDDGTLNREDLSHLVNCLTGQGEDTQLSASEMKQLIDNVSSWARPGSGREGQGLGLTLSLPQILEESDIDRDGTINLSEFQHVISRSPDFARYNGRGPLYSGSAPAAPGSGMLAWGAAARLSSLSSSSQRVRAALTPEGRDRCGTAHSEGL